MKKNRDFDIGITPCVIRKMFLVMKLLTCIMLLGLTTVSAHSFSQVRLSMSLKDASLSKIFKEITRQTGYEFVYSTDELEQVKSISLQIENQDLGNVLAQCLQETKLWYVLQDKIIVISPKLDRPQQATKLTLVTGTVKSVSGELLPGVSIILKGLQVGVTSDINGNFSIPLADPVNAVLQFSFIGMETQDVKVKGQKVLNIVMREKVNEMDEVIVTGYGNIKKSSFTGASTTVSRNDILKVSTGNVIDALQVFDPSLRMIKNTEMGSDPNTLPEFYIRGRSGMEGVKELDRMEASSNGNVSKFALTNNPNTPIFIMDGYEISVEKLYDYDINRIQSITILKDAAATAIYGSRASNGVIVIETVAPEPGKLKVSYNFTGTVTMPDLSDYNLMNAQEKLHAEEMAGLFDGTEPIDMNNRKEDYYQKKNLVLKGVDTYWLSQPLTTEFNHKHSLYIEGGADAVRFGAEIRYDNQNGVMKESSRNKIGAGLYMDYRTRHLQVRNHVTADIVKAQDSPYGKFRDYTSKQPYAAPKDENGRYVEQFVFLGAISQNPLYEASLGNFDKNGYKELTNNLTINVFILDQLQFKGQFALTYKDANTDKFIDPLSKSYGYQTELYDRGELFLSETKTFGWNTNLLLMYNNSIKKHHMNFTLGMNAKEDNSNYEYSHFRGFPSAQLNKQGYAREIVKTPDVADNHTRLFGTFLSMNYTYNNVYLLDGSVRMDGSSEFGTKKRFATFWSGGAGINVHNYEFMKNVAFIDQLKLSATFGQTGRVNYPPYAARHTYQTLLDDWNTTGVGAILYYMGNDDLKWEKTNTFNAGANIGLLKNLVVLRISWYDKKTIDLITDVTIPTSSGFKSYKDNLGEVRNRGFELDLNLKALQTENWEVMAFARMASNKNQILKISKSLQEYNNRVDNYFSGYKPTATDISNAGFSKPFLKYEEGGSLTSIFGMRSLGISPANGNEVYLNRDGSMTYAWNSSEQAVLGDSEPTVQGSFGLNVRYRGFSLYTTFMYELGAQAYNQTLVDNVENVNLAKTNADKRVLSDRWQKPGDVTTLKNIKDRLLVTRPTSRFVQDNNLLRFNSLSVGYDFDSQLIQKWGLSMLKLQFNMKDIATFSTVKQERGLAYPFARSFNLTLNVSF